MKNSTQILSHLRHRPQFSRLSHYACIQSVLRLFSPHLQKMVRFGYIRNEILFFVLDHPGAKQEFDTIIHSIKTPLKRYPPPTCGGIQFNDIRAFVTHRRPATAPRKEPVALEYTERSTGDFANPISDQRLHDIVERIRQIIHARSD